MIGRLFKLHTQKQHANSLASYLPNDRLFSGKLNDESELRKLLTGLAEELQRAERYTSDFFEQRDIEKTTDLIEEWESAVGIPDGCFTNDGTIEERRNHVLIKLAQSIQTTKDFERIGELLGFQYLSVIPLLSSDNPPIPIELPKARFIVLVTGVGVAPKNPPYTVPFIPSKGDSLIQCLFERIKPANVRFIYREDNEAKPGNYNDWAERVEKCCLLGF